ncbi:UNVERIFIED_CONTAM: hypothetical protein HDU68_000723 [Siphonaria sp. JEL0065]|nr:hypothetical protein HDU68_000723 [Siphonaria sp. JEL0065]
MLQHLHRLHVPRIQQRSLATASSQAASHTHSQLTQTISSNSNSKPPTFANKSFYQNAIVEKFASKETKLVTLRQLTVFGRHLTFEKLIRSANYVREELPVRLAHRIIGTNPHIQLIYSLYWQAFEAFRTFPEIKTLEQNRQFCNLIESQLQTHLVIIPQLAMGMAEASTPEHMTSEMADRFLNEMLRSRIGRRVLAEQHIALSDTYEQSLATSDLTKKDGTAALIEEDEEDGWIGIVNTRCKAAEVVERVSVLAKSWFRDTYTNRGIEPPDVIIDGHAHAVFTYIPDHIEYILFELFKNSMRFTLETHGPEVDEKSAAASPNTTRHVHNVLDDDRLFGLTWNEPGILPGYSKSPLRRNFHIEQRAPIYGREHHLTHLEPINPNHIAPMMPQEHKSNQKPTTKSSSTLTTTTTTKKLPPILVTVGSSRSDITFRVSDQGGGFAHSQMQNLWSYTHASRHVFLHNLQNMPKLAGKVEEIRHTTESTAGTDLSSSSATAVWGAVRASGRPFELEENSLHLGLGLPMSRVYANYWGGTIGVHSMHGFGTDAYVKISTGNQMEQLKYREGDGDGFL